MADGGAELPAPAIVHAGYRKKRFPNLINTLHLDSPAMKKDIALIVADYLQAEGSVSRVMLQRLAVTLFHE